MLPQPKIIVYKIIDYNVDDLQSECVKIGYDFYVFDKPDDFKKEIDKGGVTAIVVPLGSTNDGNIILKFCEIAENILRPEDAYISIFYSTEKSTPEHFPRNIDPRPVKSYVNDPETLMQDINWQKTIEAIKSLKERVDLVTDSVPNRVNVKALGKTEVPFPIEAVFLLRAAFNDMSKIDIKFPPKQGLSGSIACIVQPYDKAANKCALFFVKIYPDQQKANSELHNLKSFFSVYISPEYYAHYETFRRCKGRVFSIGVTDLAKGPQNKPLSFYKMLGSSTYSVVKIKSFIKKILSVLEQFPTNEGTVKLDLCKEYLDFLSTNADRENMLNSENICHRWFGNIADPEKLIEKIKALLPDFALESVFQRICHGDMHGENIMIKKISDKLLPFFIDYSHVRYQHGIKDMITLETDIIIRGLEGIDVILFLTSLEKKVKNNRLKLGNPHLLLANKCAVVIRELRRKASSYNVSEIEYSAACLLKTLSILSYGKLPFDQNQRADLYVKYLLQNIKKLSKGEVMNKKCKNADLAECIKAKAKELWEKDGCKQGHDLAYWLQAEKVVKSQTATK